MANRESRDRRRRYPAKRAAVAVVVTVVTVALSGVVVLAVVSYQRNAERIKQLERLHVVFARDAGLVVQHLQRRPAKRTSMESQSNNELEVTYQTSVTHRAARLSVIHALRQEKWLIGEITCGAQNDVVIAGRHEHFDVQVNVTVNARGTASSVAATFHAPPAGGSGLPAMNEWPLPDCNPATSGQPR